MSFLNLPWVEWAILIPLLGSLFTQFVRDPSHADRLALAATGASLLAATFAWFASIQSVSPAYYGPVGTLLGRPFFVVDGLSAPLLPLLALLHFLTVLGTARVQRDRVYYAGHLGGEALRLATFACIEPWPLIALLLLSALPPFWEMKTRGQSTRIFVAHMVLFGVLLVGGWALTSVEQPAGPILLLAAVLIRSGTFPVHLWVGDLFEKATFGTAILFSAPIAAVYIALRLVMPVAPDWVLSGLGIASLVTSLYAGGLAIVQRDARRFFASFFLSQSSLILVGLELHGALSLAGSLGLWVSAIVSLGGVGLILRSLEARFGRLGLDRHLGLYDHAPLLAVGFLLMGLASIGFPGTAGFIAAEVLLGSALAANPFIGVVLILAAMLNGIAIARVYFLLFTGKRIEAAAPLGATLRERIVVLSLVALVFAGGLFPQAWLEDRAKASRVLLKGEAVEAPKH